MFRWEIVLDVNKVLSTSDLYNRAVGMKRNGDAVIVGCDSIH